MSINLKSSIKYSENEITEILLKNTLLMIQERGKLNKKNYSKNLKNLHSQIKDDLLFELTEGKFKLGIRIVKYKVTSITKIEGIDDFLNDDSYSIRIIIFKDMNQKTFKQVFKREFQFVFKTCSTRFQTCCKTHFRNKLPKNYQNWSDQHHQ